ncbi:hypothetical protein PHMEG_000533 [Phytophthora megakarya]|uniref:Bzip transcription factor n=1 Tax=Phytophthora megakarya TaxID=4795 RepID=A0A225X3B0_9STRA|nr:hypothetical protein PHMEG_000533 [Phytophthora megakarya]
MELGIPTKQTVWNVATEYFRLFQCGVVPGAQLNFAFNFLKKTMSPDVTNGFECGPEALLENWRLISLYFNGMTVRLNRLVEVGTRSVVAITTTSITITPVTLQFAFPHLNSDGNRDVEGQKRMIAHELIGKTLILRGSVCFQWDSMAERVTAIYSQSDLLTPLLHLLGSLQSVARAFEQARVTPELMPRT